MAINETTGQVIITADDRGPLANLGAWITMVCMVIFVVIKISTKWLCVGKLQRDDFFIVVSALVAILQVVFVSLQVAEGLGQHTVAIGDVDTLQKYDYASDILYDVALSLSEVSILQFMYLLSREGLHQQLIRCYTYFIIVWTVTTVFAIVFQCSPPAVWAVFGDHCFDQRGFWAAWTVVNILLDVTAALLPVLLLQKTQIAMSKKIAICAAFAVRLLVVPVTITRLVYIYGIHDRLDLSFTMLDVKLLTVIHMNISIILTCLPFLKPVLDGLQAGAWNGDLRGDNTANTPYGSYAARRRRIGPASAADNEFELAQHRRSFVKGRISSYRSHIDASKAPGQGQRKMSGESRDPMIINQTTTIVVEEHTIESHSLDGESAGMAH